MAIQIAPTSKHDLTHEFLRSKKSLEDFSTLILRCATHSRDYFKAAAMILNYDALKSERNRDDFLDPIKGMAFAAMQAFGDSYCEGNPWPRSGAQWAQAVAPHLRLLFRQNPQFPPMLLREVLQMLINTPTPSIGEQDMFCDGLADYVLGVRLHLCEQQSQHLLPAEKKVAWTQVAQTIISPGGEVIYDPLKLMERRWARKLVRRPFALGVTQFDLQYGRYAEAGDAWLAFGHPGSGKSIFACQAMGFTAAQYPAERVFGITTELEVTSMLIRIFAATNQIPYSACKLIRYDTHHPLSAQFRTWAHEGVGSRIHIAEFRELPGTNYREKFESGFRKFLELYGQPPVLCTWDWIGGALEAGFATPWEKREAYNGVAQMMVAAADEYQMVTLTMAQANKESKGKAKLTEQDTADSKSLCDRMEAVLGITSILDPAATGDSDSEDFHAEHQYFCIPKCRDVPTTRLRVKRDFEYMRFS